MSEKRAQKTGVFVLEVVVGRQKANVGFERVAMGLLRAHFSTVCFCPYSIKPHAEEGKRLATKIAERPRPL